LFDASTAAIASFSTGFQYIGLPDAAWKIMCTSIDLFEQTYGGGQACATPNVNNLISITNFMNPSTLPWDSTFGLQMADENGNLFWYEIQLWQSGWVGQDAFGQPVFMLPF
jgi:hypothetical protein